MIIRCSKCGEVRSPKMIQGSSMYFDEGDSLELHKNKCYEPYETALVKSILKPDDIALDIGAHIGYFTLLMAKLCKHVYAFEPSPMFLILQENISLNMLTNVDLFNNAVTEKNGYVKLHLCDLDAIGASGMSRIYQSKWCEGEVITVNSISIDSIDFHEPPTFIKMDCEGSEYGALKGMKNLLMNNDVKVMMEFHPQGIIEYGANPKDVYNFMKELGYTITLLPDNNPINYEDLYNATYYDYARNVLCTPKSGI